MGLSSNHKNWGTVFNWRRGINKRLYIWMALVFTVCVLVGFGIFAAIRSATRSGGDSPIGYWTPIDPPQADYKIDCSIDPAKGTLQGTQIVRFKNTSSRPIARLAMTWMTYSKQTLVITGNGHAVTFEAGIESRPIVFSLAEPVGPGQVLTLNVEFSTAAPDRPTNPQDISDRITMTDWHPRLWWGFDTHDNYEVKLKIPDGYAAGAGGLYDSGKGVYRARAAKSFGIFLAKDHQVLEAHAKDVLVRCLYKPTAKKCAELLVKTATDVINFYRELYGFYPYKSLTIIPGQDQPVGGYPVATGIVAIHGMEKMDDKSEIHWRWITAHEIGHQYWGEYVIEKDNPGWLWIGMGIYADREYSRARGLGTDKHEELMGRYLQGMRQGYDTTINRSTEEVPKIEFDFNNVVIHGKGYSVISALDCVLGKGVFGRIQRRCLKEYGGRRLGAHEFRAVCEEESGQDLGWFFEQWVNSNRTLCYQVSSTDCRKSGDSYVSQVSIRRLGALRMPVPVEAYFEDGTSQLQFTDRLLDVDTLRFKSKTPLKQARLDPERVLAIGPPDKVLAAAQFESSPGQADLGIKIRKLPWVGAGKQALDVFDQAQKSELSDADAWFKLAMSLYDGKYHEQALKAFERVEQFGQSGSTDVFASVVWQGHLLDISGQREQALRHYERALKIADGHLMRHDQYGLRIDRQWVEHCLKEPFRRR